MKDSMALGRLAVVTDSGFSLAEAREMVGYDGPVALDTDGCSSPSQLWAQARLARFEERSRKRTRFRRRWWRRIAIIQVGGYYAACLMAYVSPFVELYKGMNLRLPWPTKLLLEPSLVPLVVLVLALAAPSRRHGEDDLEEEARLCLNFNLDLARGLGYASSALRISTCGDGRGLLDRLNALWDTDHLRCSLLRWADLAEWDLDLRCEHRELSAFVLLTVATVSSTMGVGYALFLPLYQLIGCLC